MNDTANHQKLLDIAEHFKKSNVDIDSEKKMRTQIVENNFNVLEREIANNSSTEARFRVFRDEINSIQEKQNDEKVQREWLQDKFSKDVKCCEENVRTKIETDTLLRRDFEGKACKNLDDKLFGLNVAHNRSFK